MKLSLKGWGQAVLAACISVTADHAAVLGTYSDRTSFEAVVNAGTRIDIPFASSYSENYTASGISQSGASFVGFYNEPGAGNLTVRENQSAIAGTSMNLPSFGWILLGGLSTNTTGYNDGITITPGAASTAVGFDFGSFVQNGNGWVSNSSAATQFLIRVFEGAGNMTGEYTVNGANRPNLGFFGVASSGTITGVQFFFNHIGGAGSNTLGLIDNVSYGTTTLTSGGGGNPDPPPPSSGDVPEPGTYALAGLGLLGLALMRKKS